ncbi:MAG: hypothetical protein ACKV22_24380 [Bryobacteraceae bacterium]
MIVVDSSAIVELLFARPSAPRIMERIFAEGQTLHARFLVDVDPPL